MMNFQAIKHQALRKKKKDVFMIKIENFEFYKEHTKKIQWYELYSWGACYSANSPRKLAGQKKAHQFLGPKHRFLWLKQAKGNIY